ncbi:hypothetical protein PK98_14155 [Croceibacterium mercuriale]|uniref:Uncharacterized protein n=1 Tax=Croceibacterium mercuriale TaxID=1572751 RepID=A0A0B2BZ54_9SPHN|nr:hypothetical protein [Croceibacterium mercuriale]KHL24981.1 hypothetical protein PK98_14155 [Croceibacterium mercuriale]
MGHNDRLDTLSALIARGYMARVACRCGHKVMLDPRWLLEECRKRKLGTVSFAPLANRKRPA